MVCLEAFLPLFSDLSSHIISFHSFSYNSIFFHSFSYNSSTMSQSFIGTTEVNPKSANSDRLIAEVDVEGFNHSNPPRYLQQPDMVLQTSPSFSVYNSIVEGGEGDDGLERSVTIGESIMSDFSFSNEKGISLLEGVEESSSVFDGAIETPPLYLAMGLGVGVCDMPLAVIGDGVSDSSDFLEMGLNGGDCGSEVENYCKRMVEENPYNPLFLRNYAQFLYESKGDFEGAEVYYSRAILMEPGDGETLSLFAKLIWEQHRDRQRALSYFQQAVQASPADSHVLAKYASFLWETEEEDDEYDGPSQDFSGAPTPNRDMGSASA